MPWAATLKFHTIGIVLVMLANICEKHVVGLTHTVSNPLQCELT